MLRLACSACCSLVLLAVAVTPSMGGIPNAGKSVVPNHLLLVGTRSGIADPAGIFTVTVNNLVPNVIANSQVVIDFSQCGDIQIGDQASQPWSYRMWVDAANRTVRAFSDGSGIAHFDIVGGVGPNRAAGSSTKCARFYADGVLLGSATVSAVDQDGTAGVGLSDLALLTSDFYSGTYFGRSDYDGSGTITLTDVASWAADFYSGRSSGSPGAYAW